ncbi:MAG: peptide deformylase [Candidatus Marinimicrobia bacterium CG08_land_8_20_14_0_20_45_22]|nr:MAG: peptide deformylase [Candidatus Marinimicrobia bacterium CG08_land_8_20_14_0_20_45_22]
MSLFRIQLYGSPVLSHKTANVKALIPPDFSKIIDDMFETMYADNGIGLSANQVGIPLDFFIADFSLKDENGKKMVFINPEILERQGEVVAEEGCLSIPEIYADVTRAEKVKVRYEDVERNVHVEEFSGYFARVVQHETDHLNGIYIVDRISQLKRSFIASKLKRMAADAKKGITIQVG